MAYQGSLGIRPPFPPSPNARAGFRVGTVYAIDAGDSYIYYGQIDVDQSAGFFKYRTMKLSPAEEALGSAVMSRLGVCHQSIGEAVRAGTWLKLGRYPLNQELEESQFLVMWPFMSTHVTVWKGNKEIRSTVLHDPEIQDLQIMIVYDAARNIPGRLPAEFRSGSAAWHLGGTVMRERFLREEEARRYPDLAYCALPEGWVYLERPPGIAV